jgi:hypothetical protein
VSSMARMKQVRKQGSRATALVDGRNVASHENKRRKVGVRKNRSVTHVWAVSKEEFGGYGDQGTGRSYLIPGTEFHPLVRGFLKLLGVEQIVPMADLAILTGTDCSDGDEVSGAGPVVDQGEAVFERMKVMFDPGLGTEEHKRWRVLASKQGIPEWSSVNVLTYSAFVGEVKIDFGQYADYDPAEWSGWERGAKSAAAMIWRGFGQCKTRVLQRSGGTKKADATLTFRLGSRARSNTPVVNGGPRVCLAYSRVSDEQLSCVPASLANLVVEDDPEFARSVVEDTRDLMFDDLRQLAKWLTRPAVGRIPYELRNCLPVEIRSQSSRDETNRGAGALELKARMRLNWVLRQREGNFIVTVVTSDGHASHVVGVSADRCLIFDHEDAVSLPLNASGFDATCGGNSRCIGLGEVKLVGVKLIKKRKR